MCNLMHCTLVGSSWEAEAVHDLNIFPTGLQNSFGLHWDKWEKEVSVGSVKIIRASACFGFPQGSLESPDLLKGFCLGQQKPAGSLNYSTRTQDVSPSLFFLSPSPCSWGFTQIESRYCDLSFAPVSPSLSPAWVRHLVGEPRGDHGMGLCGGGFGKGWTPISRPAPDPLLASSHLVVQVAGQVSFIPAALG